MNEIHALLFCSDIYSFLQNKHYILTICKYSFNNVEKNVELCYNM